MPTFTELWDAHPGRTDVCDDPPFENQCAMRMGEALRDCGVNLADGTFRTCVGYNRHRFADHSPGHIRSAQQLANFMRNHPSRLAAGVTCTRMSGSINDNSSTFNSAQGMVFIRNGWGRTDHIDVWDGTRSDKLKGGFNSYMNEGDQVWLWEM